ncbi:hypothetical protein PoB_006521100 [Plakobranchus ocellatus]|uniref:Uncharacterized protein n=1 Tax=Plakobranchus ocellatus TaxID=259542 RepID=A0AAV4D3Q1_9GAST|nr:hypothetical protein PoB_006521100 [Plakobranchus ocellatus]
MAARKAMANYLITPYAKNNQDPIPGSPMLVLSLVTAFARETNIAHNKFAVFKLMSCRSHKLTAETTDQDVLFDADHISEDTVTQLSVFRPVMTLSDAKCCRR